MAQDALEIIPLRHSTVEQVLPSLRPLLEPGGTLSGQSGQLFVRTSPANLAELRQALAAIDRPSRRLQILVRFDDAAQSAEPGPRRQRRHQQPRLAGRAARAGFAQRRATSASTSACRWSRAARPGSRPASRAPLPQRQVIRTPGGVGVAARPTWCRRPPPASRSSPRVAGEHACSSTSRRSARRSARAAPCSRQRIATTASGRLGEWFELGGVASSAARDERGIGSSAQCERRTRVAPRLGEGRGATQLNRGRWSGRSPPTGRSRRASRASGRARSSSRWRRRSSDAIERNGVLIAEAGTGTGKTFAYLVPALLAGGKVIISTGTKTLQDQLFHRDLPAVREALGLGRERGAAQGARQLRVPVPPRARARRRRGSESREEAAQLARDRAASPRISDDRRPRRLADVPEDAPVWAQATSTRENCLGPECPHYERLLRDEGAQRNALAADVVVVNHHLFFADVVLRDEGVAELLPACNTRDLRRGAPAAGDGAHVLRRDACRPRSWSSSRATRAWSCAPRAAPRPSSTRSPARLDKAARDLRLALGDAGPRLALVAGDARCPAFDDALDDARRRRCDDAARAARGAGRALRRACDACARRARRGASPTARAAAREREPASEVRWVEVFGQARAAARHAARRRPSCSASRWRTIRAPGSSPRRRSRWAGTSATSRASSASPRPRRARWASPFDFARQALLYVPRGPARIRTTPGFTEAVIEAALPVLRASGGRAFLLFTTLRALRRAHELLREPARRARCWCRAPARAASCSSASARSATRCCSAASRSGKASTCAATRCRWW